MIINDDGSIVFVNEDEMRQEMYGEYSKQVVDAVLSDRISYGEMPVEETVEDNEEITGEEDDLIQPVAAEHVEEEPVASEYDQSLELE